MHYKLTNILNNNNNVNIQTTNHRSFTDANFKLTHMFTDLTLSQHHETFHKYQTEYINTLHFDIYLLAEVLAKANL